ncbi:MAG: tetraacyldisaccharide 4'-kinase, partial [Chitinophagales bacterium]
MEFLFKILLAPFTLLYAIGIAIRNFLYNNNYFRAISFDIPVISVGNLSTGGTGKTPHVDYLIDLLKTHYS